MTELFKLLKRFFTLHIEKLSAPPTDNSVELIFNCIKSIQEGSNRITTWCLSVLGGSLLAILHSDYLQPKAPHLKIIYLLFVPGWVLVGVSIYYGKNVVGRTIAAELFKNNKAALTKIFENCNNDYARQHRFFNLCLLVFGIWLLLFLLWWVFGDSFYHFIYNPKK